ncbi:hypothetical protein NBRC3257_2344 [Gluconobacter thailandicus NBRC 3257]|uniref:Uncharacterized protein n=1 Tax=Gluconobacter thailandicus NBRC 3257 TaxID=1381097 RepID=A0ABQ0IYR8_GLUTH|nr:hypothetical protein NBRC3255_0795 [Gluconobacter thailandicus NBRC 3255]GAD27345.1 hypothetical protein NBRC3257_2344 [Gluconobacter thailandicus NBRC 3257]
MRGTLSEDEEGRAYWRFIPAHAGNTLPGKVLTEKGKFHPQKSTDFYGLFSAPVRLI